ASPHGSRSAVKAKALPSSSRLNCFRYKETCHSDRSGPAVSCVRFLHAGPRSGGTSLTIPPYDKSSQSDELAIHFSLNFSLAFFLSISSIHHLAPVYPTGDQPKHKLRKRNITK